MINETEMRNNVAVAWSFCNIFLVLLRDFTCNWACGGGLGVECLLTDAEIPHLSRVSPKSFTGLVSFFSYPQPRLVFH